MRVMVLVKATQDSEAGGPPDPEMMAAMGRFNDELEAAGILRMADGLLPSSHGKRIAFDAPIAASSMGPFPRSANWSRASGCGKWPTWTKRSPGRNAAPIPCPAPARSKSGPSTNGPSAPHILALH